MRDDNVCDVTRRVAELCNVLDGCDCWALADSDGGYKRSAESVGGVTQVSRAQARVDEN